MMSSVDVSQHYVPVIDVYTILKEFGNDADKNCLAICGKLLKSMTETKTIKTRYLSPVKTLLKICKMQSENYSLCSYKIIENLKRVLNCYITTNYNFPSSVEDRNCILAVVSLVFEIGTKRKFPDDKKDLTETHDYILTLINSTCRDEDNLEILVFELEILTSIYKKSFLSTLGFDEKSKDFLTLIKTLFADLILSSRLCPNRKPDKVAVYTVMYLMPTLVKFFNSFEILEAVWMEISKHLSSLNTEKLSSVLMMVCQYFHICLNETLHDKKEKSMTVIFKDKNFWCLILAAVGDRNPTNRKQGQFLLQKTVEILTTLGLRGVSNFFNDIYDEYNFVSCSDALLKVLQFLEEQQFHIIEPIFSLVKDLEGRSLNSRWIYLIYKRLIMHESSQVVKWGLSNFLKLPKEFFTNKPSAVRSAALLAHSLRNPDLYYSDSLAVILELSDFFETVSGLSSSKTFFSSFIKNVCASDWSPETLFFVMHSLSRLVKKFSFWGKEEISELKTFVSRIFQCHYVNVRIGTQYELIRAVSNLTDEADVPLENVIVFISIFSTKEIVKGGSPAWKVITYWLRSCYQKEQFVHILEKHNGGDLEDEFNDKCMALTLILFYCIYEWNTVNSLAMNYFQNILKSFSAVHKRPYCEKSSLDQYLSIVRHIYKISDSIEVFKRSCLLFVKDIILYVYTQLQQISDRKDFEICQLYLSTFEVIIENSIPFGLRSEDLNLHDLFEEISKELDSSSPPVVSIGFFWRVKILRIIYTSYDFDLKPSFLQFLLENLNECLMKDEADPESFFGFRNSWGVINSEFIIEKWKILTHLAKRKKTTENDRIWKNWVTQGDWIKLSTEVCSNGPLEGNSLALSLLKYALPVVQFENKFLDSFSEFWITINSYYDFGQEVEILHQQCLEIIFREYINRSEDKVAQEILLKIITSDHLFSLDLTYIPLMGQFYDQIKTIKSLATLFCKILANGLINTFCVRKAEKLRFEVSSYIKISNIETVNTDYHKSETCPSCVANILRLDRNSSEDQNFAKSLIKNLLKLILNHHSSIHEANLVRLRGTQALLLLEPMLPVNEDLAEELLNYILTCLTRENLQVGVRHLQEWLLIRMLLRHPVLYSRYRGLSNVADFPETGKKGLCSLMVVSFHLCHLVRPDELEKRIQSDIGNILSLCFHQNFEVRLYAMVVFMELYKLTEIKKLNEITVKYEGAHTSLEESLKMSLKGNVCRNVDKVMKNFFLKKFHPLKHYSLQTIYMDLPKLTNVEPDLWISKETFQDCGVEFDKLNAFEEGPPLTDEEEVKFSKERSVSENLTHLESEVVYYQKKIIPMNSLFDGLGDDRGRNDLQRGQLIVVASLVDCVPNLGGLARSCEVFGVKEFVVRSYKHVQDKQFTSLSVTAEKWITIKEVRIEMLLDYLTELKKSKYTVIGVEQAVDSQSLGSFVFPKKSVLLLGNEKQGIPPHLLPLLEFCVEIPQLGKIRSLNVHVAGALFMWEYAKQKKLF